MLQLREAATGSPREQLQSLTGLRIFAALAVYFSHVGAPAGAPAILSTVMSAGYYGVTFFFVLSSFVLAVNYFGDLRHPSARSLWTFASARIARVHPLYLLVLIYMIARTNLKNGPWTSGSNTCSRFRHGTHERRSRLPLTGRPSRSASSSSCKQPSPCCNGGRGQDPARAPE